MDEQRGVAAVVDDEHGPLPSGHISASLVHHHILQRLPFHA